jgi:hypothetical protein
MKARIWGPWGVAILAIGLGSADFGPAAIAVETSASREKPAVSSDSEDAVASPSDANESEAATPDAAAPEAAGAPAAKKRVPAATQNIKKDSALEVTDPRTYRLRVVIRVDAPDGSANNVVAVGPIPMEWPEQKIRMLSQKVTSGATVTESVLKGQAALLKMKVNTIPKGESASVERLYEVTRYRTHFLLSPEDLNLPRGIPREMREQFSGPAPGLEMSHPKIIELAESLRKETDGAVPWDTVKNFWSWTRENVKFENGDFRGALFAVENKCGDCEEMSALFVSLCRLSGVTARTVWVEGHDYPEFYLTDSKGKGHWIPAQVVGPAWFGEMAEYRPIFQKGDRFYDPFQKQYVRYVPHTVRADGASAQPKLTVEHQIIADSDINGPSYNSAK